MKLITRSLLCIIALALGSVWFEAAAANAAGTSLLSLNMPGDGSVTAKIMQLLIVMTLLSLAPSLLVMVTCFTRIVVVFAFLRNALGLQQSPPNVILVSLALFLTIFVMQPAFEEAYEKAVEPLIAEKIDNVEAFKVGIKPFHRFMRGQVREQDLELFFDLAKQQPVASPENIPLRILLPAFLISELRRAFEIGFLIFLPFLIIDIVVSSLLMAMGMMMLPPITISLPIKLIFFVLVDGWHMLCGSLVKSFGG